jgi:DNA modification methylase
LQVKIVPSPLDLFRPFQCFATEVLLKFDLLQRKLVYVVNVVAIDVRVPECLTRVEPSPARNENVVASRNDWAKEDFAADRARQILHVDLRRTYETCLYGSWGDVPIAKSIANSYRCQTDQDPIHPSTKPEEVLRNFFRMFVDINTAMLDPSCGSGTSVRVAEGMGAAYVLGIDINEDFVEQANIALGKARRAGA